jgi:predicted nuclease of predicted toxin-antitoxin system
MIGYYFDEMMTRKAVEQLTQRGYTVVMANDVDMIGKDDDTEHLPYATENELVLVTFDRPFAGRTMKHTNHAGLVCLSGAQDDVGNIVRTLEEFGEEHTPDDAKGRVFWL